MSPASKYVQTSAGFGGRGQEKEQRFEGRDWGGGGGVAKWVGMCRVVEERGGYV